VSGAGAPNHQEAKIGAGAPNHQEARITVLGAPYSALPKLRDRGRVPPGLCRAHPWTDVRGSSLHAAAPTERHSVRGSVAEQTPNSRESVADMFGARRWISGFSAGPCSTCDPEHTRALCIRAEPGNSLVGTHTVLRTGMVATVLNYKSSTTILSARRGTDHCCLSDGPCRMYEKDALISLPTVPIRAPAATDTLTNASTQC